MSRTAAFAQLSPRSRESALKLKDAIDDPGVSRGEIDALIGVALADAVAEGRALGAAASPPAIAPASPPAAAKADNHGWSRHIAAVNARLTGAA